MGNLFYVWKTEQDGTQECVFKGSKIECEEFVIKHKRYWPDSWVCINNKDYINKGGA